MFPPYSQSIPISYSFYFPTEFRILQSYVFYIRKRIAATRKKIKMFSNWRKQFLITKQYSKLGKHLRNYEKKDTFRNYENILIFCVCVAASRFRTKKNDIMSKLWTYRTFREPSKLDLLSSNFNYFWKVFCHTKIFTFRLLKLWNLIFNSIFRLLLV